MTRYATCMHVCMCVCEHVCMCVFVPAQLHCAQILCNNPACYMYLYECICIYVCAPAQVHNAQMLSDDPVRSVSVHICMYVCMCICANVCIMHNFVSGKMHDWKCLLYTCMHKYTHTYTHLFVNTFSHRTVVKLFDLRSLANTGRERSLRGILARTSSCRYVYACICLLVYMNVFVSRSLNVYLYMYIHMIHQCIYVYI